MRDKSNTTDLDDITVQCVWCPGTAIEQKVRITGDFWVHPEFLPSAQRARYLRAMKDHRISHSICPECYKTTLADEEPSHSDQNTQSGPRTGDIIQYKPYLIAVCAWCEEEGAPKVKIIDKKKTLEDQLPKGEWTEIERILNPVQQGIIRAAMNNKESGLFGYTHGICPAHFKQETNARNDRAYKRQPLKDNYKI
ncbi:MAG: hypothetical protein AABX47_00340 [Nanoarchaeota archaeon]